MPNNWRDRMGSNYFISSGRRSTTSSCWHLKISEVAVQKEVVDWIFFHGCKGIARTHSLLAFCGQNMNWSHIVGAYFKFLRFTKKQFNIWRRYQGLSLFLEVSFYSFLKASIELLQILTGKLIGHCNLWTLPVNSRLISGVS